MLNCVCSISITCFINKRIRQYSKAIEAWENGLDGEMDHTRWKTTLKPINFYGFCFRIQCKTRRNWSSKRVREETMSIEQRTHHQGQLYWQFWAAAAIIIVVFFKNTDLFEFNIISFMCKANIRFERNRMQTWKATNKNETMGFFILIHFKAYTFDWTNRKQKSAD